MKNLHIIRFSLILIPALVVVGLGIVVYFVAHNTEASLGQSIAQLVQTRDMYGVERHEATAVWRYLGVALLLLVTIWGYWLLHRAIERWRCNRLEREPCAICGRLQRRVHQAPKSKILSCQCYPAYTGLMDKTPKKKVA